MNVVVILLDSLRRDYLSFCGKITRLGSLGQPVHTPNLDRLAADSTIFSQARISSFACVPARRDMWTGMYDFFHRGWGPLLDTDHTPAQAFGEAGYVSMLVTDNYPLVDSGFVIQQTYTTMPVSTQPGNYHRNFTGWQLIRGNQTDRSWPADIPVTLPCDPKKMRSGAHRVELYLPAQRYHPQPLLALAFLFSGAGLVASDSLRPRSTHRVRTGRKSRGLAEMSRFPVGSRENVTEAKSWSARRCWISRLAPGQESLDQNALDDTRRFAASLQRVDVPPDC